MNISICRRLLLFYLGILLAWPWIPDGIASDNRRTQEPKVPYLQKVTKSKDFGVALIDAGKIQHGLANDGRLGTIWNWNSQIYRALPGGWFKGYGYIADLSMMMGVPEGPWTPKYKDPTDTSKLKSKGPAVSECFNQADWTPLANSFGRLHSGLIDAKKIVSRGSPPAYPVMATSTIPDTWPEGYYDASHNWVATSGTRHWPGPWAIDPGPDGKARTADDSILVGQFTGDKEAYFIMNDFDLNDKNRPSAFSAGDSSGYPLNVQFNIHAIGYGRSFAEDFIFFPMKIIYKGMDTLRGVYLGFYLDVDAPEFNASGSINHREDYMAFLRSQYEPALDTTINYNMAYIYDQADGSGIGAYKGTGPVAYTAIKLLETPIATEDIDLDGNSIVDIRKGQQLGITDWHWFRWENRPGVIRPTMREWEQYKLLSGGSKTTLWDNTAKKWGNFKISQGKLFNADTLFDGTVLALQSVHQTPDAWFHADSAGTLNPHFDDFKIIGKTVVDLDCVFIMSCGPFTLVPGDSTTFSFALIMGENFNDLKLNARTAQTMYNLNYLGADPPRAPKVTAVPGDKRVTLYWDDVAEKSKDILSRYQDFEGYRIYRTVVHPTNNKWGTEIRDGSGNVVGFQPIAQYDLKNSISGLDPLYPFSDRGSNTGLVHMYIDSTVENGRTYWYSVCPYDRGISSTNDPSLNPDKWADLNVLEAAKGNNPAQTPNLVEVIPGPQVTGFLNPQASKIVPDPDSLGKGKITPRILNPNLATATHTYSVIFDDTTKPGAVLYSVKDETGAVLVNKSEQTNGSDGGPVFNGIRLLINETRLLTYRDKKWKIVNHDTSNFTIGDLTAIVPNKVGDYIVQFYDRHVLSMMGVRVYNITDNPAKTTPVVDTIIDLSTQSADYDFTFSEKVGTAVGVSTWGLKISFAAQRTGLDTLVRGTDTTIRYLTVPPRAPSFGDEYLLRTNKPVRIGDTFRFTVEKLSYAAKVTDQDLQQIRVVPNPYMVTAGWELTSTQKRIAFTNLPPTCTVEIYTLTGELVRRIERSGSTSSTEMWNLLNTSNGMVAYGLYLYTVTAPGGAKYLGKFAVIR